MTERLSVACRVATNVKGEVVAGGHGGWYGQATDRCPKCGRSVVVTGSFHELDLVNQPAGTLT